MLDVDQPLSHVGAEMMMLNGNVLGLGSQLWTPHKLNSTHIVLKHFESNSWDLHGNADTKGD
jgi:hypothetical protein